MDVTANVSGRRVLIPAVLSDSWKRRVTSGQQASRKEFMAGGWVWRVAEKRWQGGQKSRVNPCKSKLSPASASPCTVARIISFSANPTNLWPAIPAAWKRFRIRPCRSCPPFSRFIMRVKQALYDARFIPTEFFFFFSSLVFASPCRTINALILFFAFRVEMIIVAWSDVDAFSEIRTRFWVKKYVNYKLFSPSLIRVLRFIPLCFTMTLIVIDNFHDKDYVSKIGLYGTF